MADGVYVCIEKKEHSPFQNLPFQYSFSPFLRHFLSLELVKKKKRCLTQLSPLIGIEASVHILVNGRMTYTSIEVLDGGVNLACTSA